MVMNLNDAQYVHSD